MSKVNLEIDGRTIEVEEGTRLLKAAQKLDITIPTLCAHQALSPYGACRLCLVEVSMGTRPASLQTSCTYPALEGLVVKTDSERVIKTRKMMIELLLARAPEAEDIKTLAQELGVAKTRVKPQNKDCILCGLCVRMCNERMGRSAISFVGRAGAKEISSPFAKPNEVCQSCGACDFICPTKKLIMPDSRTKVTEPLSFEFNQGLVSRPAVHLPYPQAVPNVPAIDPESCVKILTGECGICKEIFLHNHSIS